MKRFLSVFFVMLLFVGFSFATENQNAQNEKKFGLGYAKEAIRFAGTTTDLDQVAFRYWFDKSFGLDVSLGFKFGDAVSSVMLGAKVIGNFIQVNKLNIYWLAGISLGSYDPKIDGVSSFTLFGVKGGVGAEYYLLPCLSVLTELGVQFSSSNGNGNSANEFGVYADWLPQAGIRFYF